MMEEILKDIPGYEGLYKASNTGRIFGVKRNKYLNPSYSGNGYGYVRLCKNGKGTLDLVHRIIANTFINNPHKSPAVNHINGIKKDNSVANLEWITYSENSCHSLRLKNNSNDYFPLSSAVKSLDLGKSIDFPISRLISVRGTIPRISLMTGMVFKTFTNRYNNTITVLRIA